MKSFGFAVGLRPVRSGFMVLGVQGFEGCRERGRAGVGQGPVGQDFLDLGNAVSCKKVAVFVRNDAQVAAFWFSCGATYARREWSSIATWRYSYPTLPRCRDVAAVHVCVSLHQGESCLAFLRRYE